MNTKRLFQVVEKTVTEFNYGRIDTEELPTELLENSRQEMFAIIETMNEQPQLYGAILEQITATENNVTKQMKLKNIFCLFVLLEYWNRKLANQQEEEIEYILSEAFHRQMYSIYDQDQEITDVILELLVSSRISNNKIIADRVSYHLLARMKLYKIEKDEDGFNQIANVWKQIIKGVKIYDIYLEWCPEFIANSQKQTKPRYEQKQNYYLFQSRKNFKPGSKSVAYLQLNWKVDILDQLKKFNLEKLFLLLEGFKNYITVSWEREKRPSSIIIGIIINIIKKIQQKKNTRHQSSLLIQAIHWQLNNIMNLCQTEKFNYEESVLGLGLYKLCLVEGGKYNQVMVQKIAGVHSTYNFELKLNILQKVKSLEMIIISNKLLKDFEEYEKILNQNQFQDRLYGIFQKNWKAQTLSHKSLTYMAYLLSLRNQDITKNILVNYIYNFFLQQRERSILQSSIISQLLNQQIKKGSRLGIIELILKMIVIFEDFDEIRSSRGSKFQKKQSVAKKYYLYLIRQEHKQYFLTYAFYYQKFNYIKEAIFFIERYHALTKKQKPQSHKTILIRLYSKIDLEFSNNLGYISKYQKVNIEVKKNEIHIPEHKLLSQWIDSGFVQLRSSFKSIDYSKDNTQEISIMNWIRFYEPIIYPLMQMISELKQNGQIRQKVILIQITKILLMIEQQRLRKKPLSEQLISKQLPKIQLIQQLDNQQFKLVLYQKLIQNYNIFNKRPDIEHKYLVLLLSMKKSQTLKEYLYLKQKNDPNYIKRYRRYQIKQLYLNERYTQAVFLAKDTIAKVRGEQLSQIYLIYLESRYLSQMNFNLTDCLKYMIQNCITTSSMKNEKNIEEHFNYYFKMFRMIFERYTFTKQEHNLKLLEFIKKFINYNKILTENQAYLKDIIFYLLRFVLEKFYTKDKNEYGQQVVKIFKGHFKQFVPFCDYLLRKVSSNQIKNNIIQTILLEIFITNTNQCIWFIAFLRNFETRSKIKSQTKKSLPKGPQDVAITEFYTKLWTAIHDKTHFSFHHLDYILALTKCGHRSPNRQKYLQQYQQFKTPEDLIFVFDPDYNIDQIRDVRPLHNGKSSPIQICYYLKGRNKPGAKVVKVIVKQVNDQTDKYRLESNTANFFEQCNLIDKSTTYRIFNLSKSVVVIEYVQNIGTLQQVLRLSDPQIQAKQDKSRDMMYKKHPQLIRDGRALHMFDDLNKKFKLNMSGYIVNKSSNFQQWWKLYTNYVKTCAQWSMVGYLVGLGDRHVDNILMTQNCKLVHIDFEYVNDIGLRLPFPEWAPFRLTECIVEPLGELGQYGLFYSQMIKVGKSVSKKQVEFWKALSNFSDSSDNNVTQEIMSRFKFQHYKTFNTIEEGIAMIIDTSRDPSLLKHMFQGWRPFL